MQVLRADQVLKLEQNKNQAACVVADRLNSAQCVQKSVTMEVYIWNEST